MKIGDVKRGVGKLTNDAPRITTDILWIVRCPDCGRKVGWTKVSKKPNGTDIGRPVEGLIPQQLEISSALWREIVSCRRGRADYLAARGHGH